jgi:hypothetical protein
MNRVIQEYLQEINHMKGELDFVQFSMMNFPNFPKVYTFTDVDILILNTNRYSKRMFYFCERFLKILSETISKIYPSENRSLSVRIDDDIFFDFDAFIFSCKSIFEESAIKRAKKFKPKIRSMFEELTNETYLKFIKPYLLNIRNEVVHLNNFGTAIGSFIQINVKDHKYGFKLKCNYKDNSGNELDLISIFFYILDNFINVIQKLLGIYLLHYIETWGTPENNIELNIFGQEISFNDFNIPGFDGFKNDNVNKNGT